MKCFSSLLLLSFGSQASAWSCNDPGAKTMMAITWLTEKVSLDPLSVCNDGTPAAYYYAPPPVSNSSNTWLIYLAGGGQCYDETSCNARYSGTGYPHHGCSHSSETAPCFMSSKDFPQTCGKTGIFDTDTNNNVETLAGAHKVYIPYCSSDAHMGDAKFGKFQFRGLRIVTATLNHLVRSRNLDSRAKVIFGGGSAGGRGGMAWLDHAKALLPTNNVVGFLDSAYYVDVPSYNKKFVGFQEQTKNVAANFNPQVLMNADPSCATLYSGADQWKCLYGQYRAPFVKTPYFLVASQYDSWQLSHLVQNYDGILTHPQYTDPQLGFVNTFAKMTRQELRGLVGTGVYAPACYSHHISEKPLFWSAKNAAGVSMAEAFNQFLSGPAKQMIDTCNAFDCGGCTVSASGSGSPVCIGKIHENHRGADNYATPACPTTGSCVVDLKKGGHITFKCTKSGWEPVFGLRGTYPSMNTTTDPNWGHCDTNSTQYVCETDACQHQGFRWGSDGCQPPNEPMYHHNSAATAVLVTLVVIVVLVLIGGSVAFVFIKLRRKTQYGGMGGDNFLVIGEPVS